MKRSVIACAASGVVVAFLACGSDDQGGGGRVAPPGAVGDGGPSNKDASEPFSGPAGTLNWVKGIGGTISDEGRDIAAVSDGFIAVGAISAEAKFWTDDPNAIRLTSAGAKSPDDYIANMDAFVVKIRGEGTIAWAKRAGGVNSDSATGVAALDDGSAVVVGKSEGEASFGQGEPNETSLPSGQFVARYAPDGSLQWAKPTGHNGIAPRAARVSADAVVVVGTLGTSSLPAGAGIDVSGSGMFLARYEADGRTAWQKGVDGASATSIASFSDGGFIVGGSVKESATFGAGQGTTATLNAGAFVARYAADGSLSWATNIEGNDVTLHGVAAVPGGRVGIVGEFIKSMTIGSTSLTPASTESPVTAFIGVLDESGKGAWARRSKAKAFDSASARNIAAFDDGALAVVGEFDHEVTLGEGEQGELHIVGTPTLNGRFNTFLARYTADGKLEWVRRGADAERAAAVVATGTAIGWIGNFSQATTFDSNDEAKTKLTPLGGADVFIARYLR